MSSYYENAVSALQVNRDALIEQLKALKISEVKINYNGCGDSGDVMEMEVTPAEVLPLLQTTMLQYRNVTQIYKDGEFHSEHLDEQMTLHDALSDFTIMWLYQHHAGWENNEGGEGTVVIRVADNCFELSHTEFYQESSQYDYQL